jgi:putative ABC transport system permease protein
VTPWGLRLRGAAHYWRSHAAVAAGALIAAGALTGALVVGDSVRGTLRAHATSRLGSATTVVTGGDRFFSESLADALRADLGGAPVAPVALVHGTAATPDGSRRVPRITLLGVDDRFMSMAPAPASSAPSAAAAAWLSDPLARRLGLDIGDEIILRVEQPSAMPRDAALATSNDAATALRVRVERIGGDDIFGRFGLTADQAPPLNVFVSLEWLQDALGMPSRANVMLVAGPGAADVETSLSRTWSLDDAQLEWRAIEGGWELFTPRIFLDPSIERAINTVAGASTIVSTYFVNEIRRDDRSTPYSIVSAVGTAGTSSGHGVSIDPLPTTLDRDGIVINQWLADDLAATVGDAITLRLFALDSSDRLVEQEATFFVREVVPIDGFAADPTLMPEFPGIADAESSRDWEPGIPIDLDRIRDADEAYWDAHRGTPKAFLSLDAARGLWSNRFGLLTSVRIGESDRDRFAAALRASLKPTDVGLTTIDVLGPAVRAAGTTDFAALFLGLSGFVIIAAILFMALLFTFNVESRAVELGLLRAVGWTPARLVRHVLGEGAAVALVGSIAGALAGVVYASVVLRALSTIWRDAVAGAAIELHARWDSIALGGALAIVVALAAMWLSTRTLCRRDIAMLLAGSTATSARSRVRSTPSFGWFGSLAMVLGVIIAVTTGDGVEGAGGAFAGGAMILIGGLLLFRAWLGRRGARVGAGGLSAAALAARSASRRSSRSLAVAGLLASGAFLVVAVGANRLGLGEDSEDHASGTGGYTFVGDLSIPLLDDPSTPAGREALGLPDSWQHDVYLTPLRVRDGDDASCLNLNLPRHPRILAVDPRAMIERGSFSFVRAMSHSDDASSPWALLDVDSGEPDVVPAIGDHASVTWAMHKSVGDLVEYVDEYGRPFRVRIVATLRNSILQGSLIISDRAFRGRYPTEPGTRLLLVDAPRDRHDDVRRNLERSLADHGLSLQLAADRLAEFNAVQNTYLAIFQAFGWIGLLLGTTGLAAVVLRNSLERHFEYGAMWAIGFTLSRIRLLLVLEHGGLAAAGLAIGVTAGAAALAPAVRAGAGGSTLLLGVVLTGGITVFALLCLIITARVVVSRSVGESLRAE